MMNIKSFLQWFLLSKEPKALRLRQVIRISVVLGLFALLFWVIPIQEVFQVLVITNPWLFALGVVFGLLTIYLSAIQMLPLTRNQGIQRGILQIFSINLAVKFYNLLTPTTLVGSGIRWYRIAQPEGKVVEAFVALAFFRLFETFLTLVMGSGFLLISTQDAIHVSASWTLLLILVIIFTWVLITRFSLPIYAWLKAHTGSLTDHHLLRRFFKSVEKILSTASQYAKMPASGLLLMVTSGIVSALCGIISGMFLAKAIGINLDFLDLGWIQAVVSLAAQLPFTMAEGLGVREVTLVAMLSLFNISAAQALAFSLLIFARSVIIALIGGILEAVQAIRAGRVTRPEVIQQNTNEI